MKKGNNNNKKATIANSSSSSSSSQNKVKKHLVSQTERIATVLSSGGSGFSVASTSINPGTVFPWLSTQAKLYDKYRFTKLVFNFKTSGPTINFGSVGLGFDYNPYSGDPVDSEEFSQLSVWKLNSAWENFSIAVDTNRRMLPYLFTRSISLPGTDLKTYDIGRLYMVHEGISSSVPAGTLLGYIEADYTIELVDKQPATVKDKVITNSLLSISGDPQSNTTSNSNVLFYPSLIPESWVVNNNDYPTDTLSGVPASIASAKFLVLEPGVYTININFGQGLIITNLTRVDIVNENGNQLFSTTNGFGDLHTIITTQQTIKIALKLTYSSATTVAYTDSSNQPLIERVIIEKM